MIKIDLLKNHPTTIPTLAKIWREVLGKIWVPDVTIERVEQNLANHLNEDSLPLTFVAFEDDKPVGMCCLRITDGIRPNLTPWLGSLVVDPSLQGQGIGKLLIDTVKVKAKEMEFPKLYLFAFDPTIPDYYTKLGWKKIGMDEFKDLPVTVMEMDL
jgi:predicted N-acetyltransferase YhbS